MTTRAAAIAYTAQPEAAATATITSASTITASCVRECVPHLPIAAFYHDMPGMRTRRTSVRVPVAPTGRAPGAAATGSGQGGQRQHVPVTYR
ncbi:hypothetical protein GCM10010518_47180 [Kitasatospora cinereorecta]